MEKAPTKNNEDQRLNSLHNLKILNTPPEKSFDLITKLSTQNFHVPISTITLIDSEKEWHKSAFGIDQKEGDRAISFSGHALYADQILVIPNTQEDPRFSDNPMVIGDPHIHFYAGVPLFSLDNQPIGVFSIAGKKPKVLSDEEIETMKELGKWCELGINQNNRNDLINLPTKTNSFQHHNGDIKSKFLATILESTQDAIISNTLEGIVTSWNRGAEILYGYTAEEIIGKSIKIIIPEDSNDFEAIIQKIKLGVKIDNYETKRKAKNKTILNVALSLSQILDESGYIVGVGTIARDITKNKEIEKRLRSYTEELERFNKIMINREIKMIELKKEIKRLTSNNL